MNSKILQSLLNQMDSRPVSTRDSVSSRAARLSRRRGLELAEPVKVHYHKYEEKKLGHRGSLKASARISKAVKELVETGNENLQFCIENLEAAMDNHTTRFIRVDSEDEMGKKENEGEGERKRKRRRRRRKEDEKRAASKLTDPSFDPSAISLFHLDELPAAPPAPPKPRVRPAVRVSIESPESPEIPKSPQKALAAIEELLEEVNTADLIEEQLGPEEIWETVYDLGEQDQTDEITAYLSPADLSMSCDLPAQPSLPVFANDEFGIDENFLNMINDDDIEMDSDSMMLFAAADPPDT